MNIKKIIEDLIDPFLKAGDLSISLRDIDKSPAFKKGSINFSTIILMFILNLFNSF